MSEDSFVKVRIDWEPDNQKADFANHMLVTFDGAVYTLRFYQVLPPIDLIQEEFAQHIESIPGRHVATIVIASETMPGVVRALQDTMKRQVPRAEEDGS